MGWGGDADVLLHLHTCENLLCTTKFYSVLSTTLYYKVQLQYYSVLLQYYSVLQSTTPVLLCTTPVLLCTTKYYSVLLQCYSVLQSTTLYYSSTTLYYKVLLQYYSVLLSTTPVLCKTLSKHQRQQFTPGAIPNLRPKRSKIYARSDPKFTPEATPRPAMKRDGKYFQSGSFQSASCLKHTLFLRCPNNEISW